MRGLLVELARPDDNDYEAIAQWVAPAGRVASFTGDFVTFTTAEDIRTSHRNGTFRLLVLRRLADGEPIGWVRTDNEGPGCVEVGGGIREDLWEQGYGVDGAVAVLHYLFRNRNMRRVQVRTAVFNQRMLTLLSWAGFVFEGILRQTKYLDGEWHDDTIWSMLRNEYRDVFLPKVTAINKRFAPRGQVPSSEYEQARRVLAEHLRSPGTVSALATFLDANPAPPAEAASPEHNGHRTLARHG